MKFKSFLKVSHQLHSKYIKKMSNFTSRLLYDIDISVFILNK